MNINILDMIKEIYNLDNLIKIELHEKQISEEYFYTNGFKILNKTIFREGIVHVSSSLSYITEKEISKTHFLKNKIVYEKPHCVLFFSNGISKTVHYDTFDEVVNYANSLKSAFNSASFK